MIGTNDRLQEIADGLRALREPMSPVEEKLRRALLDVIDDLAEARDELRQAQADLAIAYDLSLRNLPIGGGS